MNFTLCYTVVADTINAATLSHRDYENAAVRFVMSYAMTRQSILPHKLAVIACGEGDVGPIPIPLARAHPYIRYFGKAKDCGAYLFAAHHIDTPWVIMMNSHVYWTKAGSINRLMEACEKTGPGLYGPWGSYEVSPHIRTACMAVRTEDLLRYPYQLVEPADANRFECGDLSFSKWLDNQGLPCRMVTWDGIYDAPDWRTPDNVFRKGDQSNCLIFDRHTDIYERSGPLSRAKLQAAADGK